MTVHAVYCLTRGLWLIWSEEMAFWRIIRPELTFKGANREQLRHAIETGWCHVFIQDNKRYHLTQFDPLPPRWELVMHPPKDDVSAFKVPREKRRA